MTIAGLGALALAACSGSGSSTGVLPSAGGSASSVVRTGATAAQANDNISILNTLTKETTIGSTVDPLNGDQNPYGLDIAHNSAGLIKEGDLIVCNFNDAANVQGNGTTIIALSQIPGSQPRRIAQNSVLKGCTEVALAPSEAPWASAFVANDNPIFSPNGTLITSLSNGPFHGPFGQVFASTQTPFGNASFYESNAGDGSIVRINITNAGFTFDTIAHGFAVNHGAPGSILGPSGLQYRSDTDTLYIVDGANNTVVTFSGVSTIPKNGITVSGTTFGGPFKSRAHLLFAGSPLNGPISSALFTNGHLIVGNTLDPTGQNLMVELNNSGQVLATKNVDTGAAGAIFGMIASPNGDNHFTVLPGSLKLYFNDDNDNTVRLLSR
ncbi:MAG: hypothetical protein JO233_02825 [Candidatus Eremiobacteraeota bacterium]|nr:hypothetical protein [Candidatus Eremiobacteraeota bacterium]